VWELSETADKGCAAVVIEPFNIPRLRLLLPRITLAFPRSSEPPLAGQCGRKRKEPSEDTFCSMLSRRGLGRSSQSGRISGFNPSLAITARSELAAILLMLPADAS